MWRSMPPELIRSSRNLQITHKRCQLRRARAQQTPLLRGSKNMTSRFAIPTFSPTTPRVSTSLGRRRERAQGDEEVGLGGRAQLQLGLKISAQSSQVCLFIGFFNRTMTGPFWRFFCRMPEE